MVRARTDEFEQDMRDLLTNAIHGSGVAYEDVKEYVKARRELRQAEADIEDGIADESLGRMLKQEIVQLRKMPSITD